MTIAPAQAGRLLEHHHVARYCRGRDMANGIPRENAFRLRPGEEYLSTNWLEHFHDADRQAQIAGVRQALSDKGFRVRSSAVFAVLNVGAATTACKNDLSLDIQIAALGEAHPTRPTLAYSATPRAILTLQRCWPGRLIPVKFTPPRNRPHNRTANYASHHPPPPLPRRPRRPRLRSRGVRRVARLGPGRPGRAHRLLCLG